MRPMLAVFLRDVGLALRSGGGAVQTLVFFALAILLFGLAVGPERAALARIAAPAIWVTALLSALMSLDRLFQADAEDGALDVIVQRTDTLALLVLAKAAAHWTTACLPLIAAAPAMGLLLALPEQALLPLILSLIVGTPSLSLIGALAAAATFPLRRAGVLVSILVGPLYAPAVIFGVSAAEAGAAGTPEYGPSLLFLAVGGLLALIVAPIGGAAAVRVNLS